MSQQDYRGIAVDAKRRRLDALPRNYSLPQFKLDRLAKDVTTFSQDTKIYSHDEIEIINSEAEDILLKIRESIWSAAEVTEAFCKAATISHQLTYCITEVLFTEARQRARELDQHLATTGEVIGPLHGLPISLKDCFITPPHPSSIGMAAYANTPTTPDQESTLVTLLRSLGAVAYVKTNVPVAMMMMETTNNIWGPTVNPYHRMLSSGGSSGGESALIAMRGSALGIGTDIGGSIRIPSAFCQLYGLRPSFGRYPTFGTRSGIPGQEVVNSVNGPMARSLESLVLYSSAVLSSSAAPWSLDPKVVPLPWKAESQLKPPGRKLRIAFFGPSDGNVSVHPPVERAFNMTRKALEAAGHEVVEWKNPLYFDLVRLMGSAFLDFGAGPIMQQLEPHGEPVFPAMSYYKSAADAAATAGTGLGPDLFRQKNVEKLRLQKSFIDSWQATALPAEGKQAIDGIVSAVSPWAAVRAGFTNKGPPDNQYVAYTGWVNVLDLPSCTFPVTKADAQLDPARESFAPTSDQDQRIQADYDADFYDGAPVGLQLVGERLQEEKVLEVVAVMRDSLKGFDGAK